MCTELAEVAQRLRQLVPFRSREGAGGLLSGSLDGGSIIRR
jgi:hypothetical protein